MCQRTNRTAPAHTQAHSPTQTQAQAKAHSQHGERSTVPGQADADQALDQAQSLDREGLWPCRRVRTFLLSQPPALRPRRG
jgi:hypothetical protein